MTALTAALAVGVGIHLALALFLSLRYLEGREAGLYTTSVRLLFWGLLLGGIHSLDYPLLRLQPVVAAIGAALSGLFALIFAIGAVLWVLDRSRDLGTMSTIAEALNRSLDTREVLPQALRQILGLMRAHGDRLWAFEVDAGIAPRWRDGRLEELASI